MKEMLWKEMFWVLHYIWPLGFLLMLISVSLCYSVRSELARLIKPVNNARQHHRKHNRMWNTNAVQQRLALLKQQERELRIIGAGSRADTRA